jgi:hypothetical protein
MDVRLNDAKTGKLRLHQEAELPIDGLTTRAQDYINEVVRVYNCPREFPTVAVFSAFSTIIGKRVKVTDGKYYNPLMLWFVNVAPSGSNKTQPVKEVLKPLRDLNRRHYQEYTQEYNSWKSDKSSNEDNEPLFDQLLVGDTTEEARIRILQSSRIGAVGYYSEIKGFFDDQERYNKNGGDEKLLNLFDGDDIFLNRKGENKPIVISDAFMNILGDLQPGLLKSTFGTPQRLVSGLTTRFLFTMPNIREFPKRSKEKMDDFIAGDWRGVARKLYDDDISEWNPILIAGESDELYNDYFNSLQSKKEEVKATTEDNFILSLYSKLQIQAMRLAGIVHLINVFNSPSGFTRQVSAHDMEYTIRCMEYYEKTALAVYEQICGGVSPFSGKLSQDQAIREFNRIVPITNRTWFAKGINKNLSQVSRALNTKDKP